MLVLTLAAIACYSMTLAPVTWVLISEIFPNRLRSLGVPRGRGAVDRVLCADLHISRFSIAHLELRARFLFMPECVRSDFSLFSGLCRRRAGNRLKKLSEESWVRPDEGGSRGKSSAMENFGPIVAARFLAGMAACAALGQAPAASTAPAATQRSTRAR